MEASANYVCHMNAEFGPNHLSQTVLPNTVSTKIYYILHFKIRCLIKTLFPLQITYLIFSFTCIGPSITSSLLVWPMKLIKLVGSMLRALLVLPNQLSKSWLLYHASDWLDSDFILLLLIGWFQTLFLLIPCSDFLFNKLFFKLTWLSLVFLGVQLSLVIRWFITNFQESIERS